MFSNTKYHMLWNETLQMAVSFHMIPVQHTTLTLTILTFTPSLSLLQTINVINTVFFALDQ